MLFGCRTACLHVWMMWHAGWLLTKTEVLWCSSTRHQHQIPDRTVRIRSTAVQPVRELGIMLDGEVTMSAHVSAVVKASFAALRRIRSMRRSIPRRALLTLIQALVVSKVDYCNSLLAGVSDTLLRRLQSVLNAAARLVFSARKSEHHSATRRTTLAESSIEDKVSALCSGFPTPSWYSATVPRRDLASDNQPQFLQSPAVCCHVDTDRSSHVTTDPGRPCVSSCSCPCLELSAVIRQR